MLYLIKHHESGATLQTLLRALYVGGDVDSLAALCLGLVGAREGLRFGEARGLPMFLIEELEAVEYLVETAEEFGAWVELTSC